jgi:hypothetical protein
MKLERKTEIRILVYWFLVVAGFNVALRLYPHQPFMDGAILNIYIQVLLFILCVYIAWKCYGAQKPIFVNFAVLFGFVVPLAINKFIPAENLSLNAAYFFYVNKVALNALGLFAIGYCIVDYVLQQGSVLKKYLVTGALTAGAVLILFHPFILNSSLLSKEPVYVAFREIQRLNLSTSSEPVAPVTVDEMVQALSGSSKIRDMSLSNQEIRDVVETALPYVRSNDATAAYWRPVFLATMRGNVLLVIIVIGFLVANFRRGKPHGPYIDKILLLFLLYGATEALHSFDSLTALKAETGRENFTIGQYFSIVVFMAMVYSFDLRLRFSLSPAGLYYERLLQTDPSRVTRLKDEVDRIILASFFSPDRSLARLANLSERSQYKE